MDSSIAKNRRNGQGLAQPGPTAGRRLPGSLVVATPRSHSNRNLCDHGSIRAGAYCSHWRWHRWWSHHGSNSPMTNDTTWARIDGSAQLVPNSRNVVEDEIASWVLMGRQALFT